jgi:4-amino-4-deoxy-L-arabinose transferase-like glycosyltransferase
LPNTRGSIRSLRHRASRYLGTRSNLLFAVLVLVVLVVHATVFFVGMVTSPLGFDEAFIIQAPLNLVEGNGYATENYASGGPKVLFDAVVSTGPVVGMPVALSFLLFGTSIEAARIVMLPFLALLLGSLFVIGRRVGGRWAGLAAMAAVLALNTRVDWPDSVLYGPSDAIGEFAAAALLALALALVPRVRGWVGVVIGLAALTKFIVFLAVPVFVIALLLVPRRGASWWARAWEVLLFGLLAVLPSALWEGVKLITLGLPDYVENLRSYYRFVLYSGSGAVDSLRGSLGERASWLFTPWYIPDWLAIAFAVVLLLCAGVGVWLYVREAPEPPGEKPGVLARLRRGIRSIPLALWATAGILVLFSYWWIAMSSSFFVRHTMPFLIALVPVLVAAAFRGMLWLNRRGGLARAASVVLIGGFVVTIAVQASFTTGAAFRAEAWTRAQQVEAADFVVSLGVDEVQGIDWWAAPDVRFLSHVPSTPLGTGDGPLVLEPIMKLLNPAAYATALGYCTDVLYDRDGFIVCDAVYPPAP